MKALANMNQDELENLSEDVAQLLISNLPRDAVWVLVLGDQERYRCTLSNKNPEAVLEILKFAAEIVAQQTIENN